MNRFILFTLILSLFANSAFAEKCAEVLDPESKIETHFRSISLKQDPLFNDVPGETASQRRERRSAAVYKMLRWAAHSPEYAEQARVISRGQPFNLTIPLYDESTPRASRQRLFLEYKRDGEVYYLDSVKLFQANGKSISLDKTPITSGGDQFNSPHILWRVDVVRDAKGKIVNEIIEKDKDKDVVYKIDSPSKEALDKKIAELSAEVLEKGGIPRIAAEEDSKEVQIPIKISGKILSRFIRWGDKFDEIAAEDLAKVDGARKAYPLYLKTVFNQRVRAFFKNGGNRLQKYLWVGIVLGAYYLYGHGLHFSLDKVNGVNHFNWSFQTVSIEKHEADTFKQVQREFGLPPLTKSNINRDNVIHGPLDYRGLGLPDKPDAQDFKGSGFASLFEKERTIILTAVTTENGPDGSPALVSRIVKASSNPMEYSKLFQDFKLKEKTYVEVPSPDEIVQE